MSRSTGILEILGFLVSHIPFQCSHHTIYPKPFLSFSELALAGDIAQREGLALSAEFPRDRGFALAPVMSPHPQIKNTVKQLLNWAMNAKMGAESAPRRVMALRVSSNLAGFKRFLIVRLLGDPPTILSKCSAERQVRWTCTK
jgi:hypothetical protein